MVNPTVLQTLGVSAVLIYVCVVPLGLHKGERFHTLCLIFWIQEGRILLEQESECWRAETTMYI